MNNSFFLFMVQQVRSIRRPGYFAVYRLHQPDTRFVSGPAHAEWTALTCAGCLETSSVYRGIYRPSAPIAVKSSRRVCIWFNIVFLLLYLSWLDEPSIYFHKQCIFIIFVSQQVSINKRLPSPSNNVHDVAHDVDVIRFCWN